MKKIFLLILIGFSFCSYAQNYGVYVKTTYNDPDRIYRLIELETQDSEFISFYLGDDNPTTYHHMLYFNNNESDTGEVHMWGFVNGDCESDMSYLPVSTNNFNTFEFTEGEQCFVSFEMQLIHTVEPNATNNSLCLEDQINLKYGKEWQYSFNESSWTDFPSSLNVREPSFILKNLIGETASNQVSFRTGYNGKYTNIVKYNIIKCSPKVNGVTTNKTTCSYKKDGRFTVTFNRPLDPGENLNNLSLHWAGLDNILDTPDDVSGIDGLPTASYTGTNFTWPKDLAAGTYRFLYQSGSAKNESFEPIIINAPPPISFTATKSDIVCFDEGNGEITITVDPENVGNVGTPPYSYSLNGALPPVPFSGKTHTITELLPGKYAVKVFDANDCTEQQ